MIKKKFSFATNTAAVAIFDPQALLHRCHDSADWWANPFEEVEEINNGNLVVVGLAYDGVYQVFLSEDKNNGVSVLVKCLSGEIFVGPGEEISGGGYAPFQRPYTYGSIFDFRPGVYRVYIEKSEDNLHVGVVSVEDSAVNYLSDQILLD